MEPHKTSCLVEGNPHDEGANGWVRKPVKLEEFGRAINTFGAHWLNNE